MKRRDLERHLERHGCRLVGEGGRHTKWRSEDGARWREDAEEWARRLPATFRGTGGSVAAVVIHDDANPRADYFVSRPGDFTITKPSP